MSREIRISKEAEDQITLINGYIAQGSQRHAGRWRVSLRKCLESLKRFPQRHEIAYPADIVGCDVRHTFLGVYRILYVVDDDAITVVGVRHGARRPLTSAEVRRTL